VGTGFRERSGLNKSSASASRHVRQALLAGPQGSANFMNRSEHDPEKWVPVSGQDHAQPGLKVKA
jgi:hypothetical protein